ncbi:MAG: carbohydrate binding domain-containing protein [Oligoflexia bacterium]|nr:carbohydrate binding domain-containing protein [Oligoflexia bacterium]
MNQRHASVRVQILFLFATLCVALLAVPLMPAAPACAQDESYPRLGIYGSTDSVGQPFVDISSGGLIPEVLQKYAAYDLAILNASPLTDARRDIVPALRAINPVLKIFAYVVGHVAWCNPSYPAGITYYRDYWRRVSLAGGGSGDYAACDWSSGNGFLWTQSGAPATSNVNLAKRIQNPDSTYSYPVAEAIADLIYEQVYSSPVGWNGIFFDVMCEDISWQETSGMRYDYARAGYGANNADPVNRTAFFQGWTAGQHALGARLRSRIPNASFPIVGNCALGTQYSTYNGWMSENFPYQNGGTWETNIFGMPAGGYLNYEQNFRAPRYNFLFSAAVGANIPYSTTNTRKARLGLGSAALATGFGVFGDSAAYAWDVPYYNWWYDEYAVDLETGRASRQRRHTGWLGRATSTYYQMVSPPSDPNRLINSTLDSDTSGWTFRAWSPAAGSMLREEGAAPQGSANIRLEITQAGTSGWHAALSNSALLNVSSGVVYSATLWAKASSPRTIGIVLGGSPDFGSALLTMDTTWRRYQVVITPSRSGQATLRLEFGNIGTGSFQLDDIQFAQGVNSVYRRDFQNGIVLVNPDVSAKTVVLEHPYTKILGTADSTVNDGSTNNAITVAGADALFLIEPSAIHDRTPPAAPGELAAAATSKK